MKKNKKFYIIVLLVITMLTTGCGSNSYIKDEKGKLVTNSETGQSLQKTIYCKPSEKTEMYKLYEKYEDQMEVKLSNLPSCDKYKITSNKTAQDRTKLSV